MLSVPAPPRRQAGDEQVHFAVVRITDPTSPLVEPTSEEPSVGSVGRIDLRSRFCSGSAQRAIKPHISQIRELLTHAAYPDKVCRSDIDRTTSHYGWLSGSGVDSPQRTMVAQSVPSRP